MRSPKGGPPPPPPINKKCRLQYVGETDRTLKDRFLDHRGYVRREELEKATVHKITFKFARAPNLRHYNFCPGKDLLQ